MVFHEPPFFVRSEVPISFEVTEWDEIYRRRISKKTRAALLLWERTQLSHGSHIYFSGSTKYEHATDSVKPVDFFRLLDRASWERNLIGLSIYQWAWKPVDIMVFQNLKLFCANYFARIVLRELFCANHEYGLIGWMFYPPKGPFFKTPVIYPLATLVYFPQSW